MSTPRANRPPADAPPGYRPAHGDPGYTGGHRLPQDARRRLAVTRAVVIGVAAVAVVLIVGLFFAGRVWGGASAVAGSGDAASEGRASDAGAATDAPASDAALPTPTGATAAPPAVGTVPAAPAAPGEHPFTDLAGGECLTGYTSPFAETFTVVDCAAEHTAQLVAAGVFDGDAAAAFPGEGELASRMNLLCTAPTVLDYGVSGAVPDIQWQAAYPLEAAWNEGDRRWFCFFSRNSGAPLGASLVPVAG
jgi:hypothetical protein